MKVVLLVLALQTAAIAQTPSLADAAKQERARRQNLPPAPVINNETVRNSTAPAISDLTAKSPEKGEVKPGEKTTDKAKGEGAPHDEAWWRETFQKARTDVKRAEDHAKVVELELNQLNTDFLQRSDVYNRENVIGPKLDDKRKELATAQSQVDRAREKLAQLEEDLRQSGGAPGWAR